eukprot:6696254-Prymnesium_polylepis.1
MHSRVTRRLLPALHHVLIALPPRRVALALAPSLRRVRCHAARARAVVARRLHFVHARTLSLALHWPWPTTR